MEVKHRFGALRPIIYIAGPMALGSMMDNIRMAWDAAERLRDAGFSPIVPQDSFFGAISGKRRSHADWLDIDKPFVLASAAVLRLPGESRGADMEAEWAILHWIPVFEDVEDLITRGTLREDRTGDVCVPSCAAYYYTPGQGPVSCTCR